MTDTTSCSGWIEGGGPLPLRLRQTAFPQEENGGASPRGRAPEGDPGALFAVRVVDNPTNTYEEVMTVCCRALGLSLDEAFQIAHTIDHEGSCVVCQAPQPEAERVAGVIRTIGIEVRIEPKGGVTE